MKRMIGLAMAVWCALALTVPAQTLKLAVLDMEKAVRAHPDTADAEDLLKRQLKEYEDEQEELQTKGEAMRKELEAARDAADDRALGEAEREKRLEELKEKLMVLRQHEQRQRETRQSRQRELTEQEARMLKRILGKVQEVVGAYAAEKGYTLVLDAAARNPGGVPTVVYAAAETDITAAIVKLVEAAGKDKAAADAKP